MGEMEKHIKRFSSMGSDPVDVLVGLVMGIFIGLGIYMFGDGISCIKWSFMYGLLGAIVANIRRTNSNLTDSNAGKWLHFWNSQQHNFDERAVFAGCGVRAVGTNESNAYRRT